MSLPFMASGVWRRRDSAGVDQVTTIRLLSDTASTGAALGLIA